MNIALCSEELLVFRMTTIFGNVNVKFSFIILSLIVGLVVFEDFTRPVNKR